LRRHFDGTIGPFPKALVETAEGLFAELLGSMDEDGQVLLHGDLHHWNILAAQRQPWLALDPKGIVGERAYEVAPFLLNPMPGLLDRPQPERIMARRIDQLAQELGFDRARLLAWGLAHAVLSAWWSYKDHGHGWEAGLACAELLAALYKKAN
jgi:streptomycin 6-kinase